jgi:hypothetical protein
MKELKKFKSFMILEEHLEILKIITNGKQKVITKLLKNNIYLCLEWKNWALIISPTVLLNLLPQQYFNTWLQFIKIVHFIMSEEILKSKIESSM